MPRASAGRFERVDVEAYDESRTATAPLTGAETRLAKARAERAIRQLQVLLDQQAPAVVLDRIWSLDRDAIRARLRQLPAAAAGALAGEANPRRCQSLIQDYVRVALEELTARSHDDLPEGLADGVDLSYDQVPPVGRNLQQHRQALADARARMIVCENRLADGTDLLLDAEGRFWTDRLLVMKSSLWHSTSRRIKPAVRLVRAWKNQTHIVTVLADGRYEWDGQRYRSLSAIAKEITGTSWNGRTFFGTKKRSAGRAETCGIRTRRTHE